MQMKFPKNPSNDLKSIRDYLIFSFLCQHNKNGDKQKISLNSIFFYL